MNPLDPVDLCVNVGNLRNLLPPGAPLWVSVGMCDGALEARNVGVLAGECIAGCYVLDPYTPDLPPRLVNRECVYLNLRRQVPTGTVLQPDGFTLGIRILALIRWGGLVGQATGSTWESARPHVGAYDLRCERHRATYGPPGSIGPEDALICVNRMQVGHRENADRYALTAALQYHLIGDVPAQVQHEHLSDCILTYVAPQETLAGGSFGRAPSVRGSDTSLAAAASLTPEVAATLRLMVLGLVIAMDGATCDEMEVELKLRHQTTSARIRELVIMGVLFDSGDRRLTRSARPAVVWRAVSSVAVWVCAVGCPVKRVC